MELYDEKVEEKTSKLPKIIGILIGVLIVIICIIIACIIYLQSSLTTIKIDGQNNNKIEEMLYIEQTEQGSELYIPIIKISEFLGYEGFTGDIEKKSEDKNKCHVIGENEIAMFTADSDILIKRTEADSKYSYVKIDKPVIEKDGELYTTVEGIEKAFNVIFGVDENYKNISIITLDYLIQYYTSYYKIEDYDESFNNQKAILEDELIIENNNKYGVINVSTGKYTLEPKYEQINYFPDTTDFLVKSSNKYGIITKEATTKIKTIYDDIKIMDSQNCLYLVKQNNTYGIVDFDGKVILEPEYKKIGIDIDEYTQNGVDNGYILLDTVIPIQNSEGLWGFFDLKGEKISNFQYTGVGCEEVPGANTYPAVVIPSHNVIVVEKDKKYNLIKTDGEELISGFILDSVYLKSSSSTDQNQFFMTSNDNTKIINIEEWLTSIGG